MFERLADMEEKYEDLQNKVNDADIISRQNEWREYMKELSHLTPIVECFQKWNENKIAWDENKELLEISDDKEMIELIEMELDENKNIDEALTEELKILLLPKDENDDKNVIVEIRGGAGGDEAALFAGDLFRMYTRYAERHNWKTEIVNANENDIGGFREVSFMINGKGAYSRLKFESGVHRVQRVPETESSGRIHTSTVTVAVLPEAEEVDVEIDPNDVKVDTFRSSGNGGQSVNTTDSAVRLTHEPTGIVVSCQDEKSQHKNRDKAFKVLRAKVYELELEKQQGSEAAERKSQIGSGDRSERIRTYNFPQGRMTDHRVGLTMHNLEGILDGDLDEMMDIIITTNQAEMLKNMGA